MKCECKHHKVVPMMLILIALVFLLKGFGVVTSGFTDIAWPILLGVAGFTKLKQGKCKCC